MDKPTLEELFGISFSISGDNWKGLCPFHNENTPSFYIHRDNYIGNCFGCGISGSLSYLLAKKRGISKADARSLLGIEVDFVPKAREERTQVYPESWLSPWKRLQHHPYLAKRDFSDEVCQEFGARWDTATKRIVFPLRSFAGKKLVGAAGRTTTNVEPKWYFYWNCNKSHNLFIGNIDLDTPTVIVEGIFDCMWLTQNGYPAVAILGSKVSPRQVHQLKTLGNEFVIALDNDEAGQSGSELLEEKLRYFSVKHASLPPFANDVCDLTSEQLDEILTNSITPLEKKLSVKNY